MAKFRVFRTESLQTKIFNLIKMAEDSPIRYENTPERGEIACFDQIFYFPTVFLKDLHDILGLVWERVRY